MYDLGVKMSADLIPRLVGKNRAERIDEIVKIMNETGFHRQDDRARRARQAAARRMQELRLPRSVEGLSGGLPLRHRLSLRPDGRRGRAPVLHAARRRRLPLPLRPPHEPRMKPADALPSSRRQHMAIDFTLTSAQQRLQRNAREFAVEILQPLVKAADEEPDTQKAFQILKGAYVECHKLGFAMGFLPKQYGGGGVSNVDLQIVAEEITAVDPGFATVLLVNGLALMPIAWFGSEEQKRKWLGEATSDPRGEYIAGWTVSEAAGSPGGTANFDHPGPAPDGHRTGGAARHGRGEYVLERHQALAVQCRRLGL